MHSRPAEDLGQVKRFYIFQRCLCRESYFGGIGKYPNSLVSTDGAVKQYLSAPLRSLILILNKKTQEPHRLPGLMFR